MKLIRCIHARSSMPSHVHALLFAIFTVTTLFGCLEEIDERPENKSDTGLISDTEDISETDIAEDTSETDIAEDTEDAEDQDAKSQQEIDCEKLPNQHFYNGNCIREPILALGIEHTCALFPDDHALKCWGATSFGQLGIKNPAEQTYPTPQSVPFDPSYGTPEKLYASFRQSCLITSKNQVWCWGRHKKFDSTNSDTDEVPTAKQISAIAPIRPFNLH